MNGFVLNHARPELMWHVLKTGGSICGLMSGAQIYAFARGSLLTSMSRQATPTLTADSSRSTSETS